MSDDLWEQTTQQDGGTQTVLRAPSTDDALEAMKARLCEWLRDLELPQPACFALELALQEAVTNAAVHGNQSNPTKKVTVTCRREPHQVTLIVDNEGEGFDYGQVADPTAAENLLRESGRGVLMMRHFADECYYQNGGRRVVIVKHIR